MYPYEAAAIVPERQSSQIKSLENQTIEHCLPDLRSPAEFHIVSFQPHLSVRKHIHRSHLFDEAVDVGNCLPGWVQWGHPRSLVLNLVVLWQTEDEHVDS